MLSLYRRDYAPGARQEPHTHALPSIALLVRGAVVERSAAIDDPSRRATSRRMDDVAERVSSTNDSVETIARELAMHRIALARAFRRAHGCSITDVRRRSRVRRAASLIGSDMPLAAVALESGFSDQSHFCRHFKLELGLTPAAFRGLIHSRPATGDDRY